MGDAHEIVAAGGRQQGGQVFDVILVGLHMVGVAGVAAHGDAGQLAHEVILQTGANDLPGVIEVFRADEPHHGVHQEGLIAPGKAVAPGLHGHLIGAVVSLGGQLRALAGLKIHDVGAGGGALMQGQLPGLLQEAAGDAEGLVALLAAGDGLEDQIRRGALLNGVHLGGHMAQDADLGGNLPAPLHVVEQPENLAQPLHGVRHRVQAQDRVACAEAQPLRQRGQDAVGIVGGVVGLQAAAEGAGQADGGVAVGGDADFGCRIDQIQVAHELAHGGNHLGGQAPGDMANLSLRGVLRQKPLPQPGDGPAFDALINRLVEIVLDDAGDLVFFVGNHGILPQIRQGQLCQHGLGGDALFGVFRRNTGQLVAGFFLVGLGQNLLDGGKGVGMAEELGF